MERMRSSPQAKDTRHETSVNKHPPPSIQPHRLYSTLRPSPEPSISVDLGSSNRWQQAPSRGRDYPTMAARAQTDPNSGGHSTIPAGELAPGKSRERRREKERFNTCFAVWVLLLHPIKVGVLVTKIFVMLFQFCIINSVESGNL